MKGFTPTTFVATLAIVFGLGYGVRFVDGTQQNIEDLQSQLSQSETLRQSLERELSGVLGAIAPAAGEALPEGDATDTSADADINADAAIIDDTPAATGAADTTTDLQ